MAVNIDWSMAEGPNIYGAFTQGMEQGQQARRQKVTDAYYQSRIDAEKYDQARQTTADERAAAGRKTAGELLAKRDYAGAQTAALGDKELYDHIGKMRDDERKQLADWNASIGQTVLGLFGPDGKLRPDAAARWQAGRQQLLGGGVPESMLGLDVTQPGAAEAELAEAGQLDDLLKAIEQHRHNTTMETRPMVLSNGAVLAAPGEDGAPPTIVARNPKTFAPPRPSSGAPAVAHGPVVNIDPNQVQWK